MLTKREKEIIALIYEGMTSKEIGNVLFISTYTVDTHCRNMKRKLGVHTKAGLVREALRLDLCIREYGTG